MVCLVVSQVVHRAVLPTLDLEAWPKLDLDRKASPPGLDLEVSRVVGLSVVLLSVLLPVCREKQQAKQQAKQQTAQRVEKPRSPQVEKRKSPQVEKLGLMPEAKQVGIQLE